MKNKEPKKHLVLKVLLALLPMAYRIWASPTELYDGMILVSNAHPIEIQNSKNH